MQVPPDGLPIQVTECCPTVYPEGRIDMSAEFGVEIGHIFHWSCRVAVLITEAGICRGMFCFPVAD